MVKYHQGNAKAGTAFFEPNNVLFEKNHTSNNIFNNILILEKHPYISLTVSTNYPLEICLFKHILNKW